MNQQKTIPFGSAPIAPVDKANMPKTIPFGSSPSGFPPAEPPQSHLSFMQKLGNAFKALPGQALEDIKGGAKNIADIGSGVINDFKTGGQAIMEDAKKTSFNMDYNRSTQQNVGTTVLDIVGQVAKAALSPITQTVNKFSQSTAEQLANIPAFEKFANSKWGDAIAHSEESVSKAYNDWAQNNPEVAKDLVAAFNVANLAVAEKIPDSKPGSGVSGKVVNALDKIRTKVGGAAEDSIPTIKSVYNGYKQMATDIADQTIGKSAVNRDLAAIADKKINTIQETISPKITSAETKAIIDEGRLTRGKDSAIFGKRPDIVTQAESVQKSAETISKLIPNAEKMSDAELSTALKSKIGDLAQGLKPQMKATDVKFDTLGKMKDSWSTLKAEQASRPEFMDHQASNIQYQKQFENYLNKLNREVRNPKTQRFQAYKKTMQDVWDARQAYDDSIPANVKNANSSSPPQYQARKEMWLENRSILNSVINDTADGLGESSKQGFLDMSRMYDARENISSKAKIDLTGKPGAIPATKKDLLKWGIGAGATIIGADWLLKKVGF